MRLWSQLRTSELSWGPVYQPVCERAVACPSFATVRTSSRGIGVTREGESADSL